MTLKELSQLRYLKREIKQLEARLSRDDKCYNQNNIAITKNRLKQCDIELMSLNDYIAGCPDSLTRQILTYRFVDGLSWNQIAAHTGITPAAAKMIAYRYIRKK